MELRLWETVGMAKRNLNKLVFIDNYGICQDCGRAFKGDKTRGLAIKSQIAESFKEHTCKKLDASQNAARIVREATEQ